jgi:hypothetical protein
MWIYQNVPLWGFQHSHNCILWHNAAMNDLDERSREDKTQAQRADNNVGI